MSALDTRFQKIKNSQTTKIKQLADMSKPNPQTIRELRLALRTPFLGSDIRSQFEETLKAYYAQSVQGDLSDHLNEADADTNIVHNEDLTPAIKSFLAPLVSQPESSSYVRYYQLMLKDDLRLSLPVAASLPANSSEMLDRLYLASLDARQLALSHGSHTSYWEHTKQEQSLPWTGPSQFLAASQARHRQLQGERLATAAWGDGELFDSTLPPSLFFFRLGTKYTDSTSNNSLVMELLDTARKQLDQAANRILRMNLQFEGSGNSVPKTATAHALEFRVNAVNEDRPTAYVTRERVPPLANSTVRSKFLTQPAAVQVFPVDAAQLESQPTLVLAFRGHYRTNDLKIQPIRSDDVVNVDFSRSVVLDPTLRVIHNSPQKTKVIVMLDCSESMDKFTVRNREGRSVTAFVEAKRLTEKIIEELQSVNESHNLELGLIIFGGLTNEAAMTEMNIENNQIRYSQVRPVDKERRHTDELLKIVRELEPDEHNENHNITLGCTPLYDAISCAAKRAQGTNALIYVVSDGYNEPVKDKPGRKDYLQWTHALGRQSKSRTG